MNRNLIVNVCLCGRYSDGFTYQDNLLPKYQRKLGFDVTVIAPTCCWGKDGSTVRVEAGTYRNSDDVEVIRIEDDQSTDITNRMRTYRALYGLLESLDPAYIFLHGVQFRNASAVAKYAKRHPECSLYVDNHTDYTIGARGWPSKYILHGILWRHQAHTLLPYAKRFWGVLPARVEFLKERYKLPSDKCDLLIMGADDDEVARVKDPEVRKAVRDKLGIGASDVLLVTGGRFDAKKPEIIGLMQSVSGLPEHVKLLVFGPVTADLKEEFESEVANPRIIYVPWASASDSYEYFSAADIVAFPMKHSVYWEQAAAMGKPLLLKYWPNMEHFSYEGSAYFLDDCSMEGIRDALSVCVDETYLSNMTANAETNARHFLYKEIAPKSIGLA